MFPYMLSTDAEIVGLSQNCMGVPVLYKVDTEIVARGPFSLGRVDCGRSALTLDVDNFS